jgi:hypothetical protein
MAWQTRGDKSYFYRSVHVDGRTHKVYLGFGAAAEQPSEEVRARRPAAPLDALDVAANLLTRGGLVTAGYREHGRCWRERRPDGPPGRARRRGAANVVAEES